MAARVALVSTFCPDRVGLVSAVTGKLFDHGVNLRDVAFAVLGRGAEFSAVCDLPDGFDVAELQAGLHSLPELEGAQIKVLAYDEDAASGPLARVTHRVEVSGGDQPGLIARLSEIFTGYEANIVRLDAQTLPDETGGRYTIRFAVSIAPDRADTCLSAVANTAEHLGLSCEARAVG